MSPVSGEQGAAFVRYSDAARRCSDQVSLHAVAGSVWKWAAIRLEDGGSDGVPYDTREEAIKHQLHEQFCCYVQVPPTGMTPRQAENFLKFNRALYQNGMRITDPDKDRHVHIPHTYQGGRIV